MKQFSFYDSNGEVMLFDKLFTLILLYWKDRDLYEQIINRNERPN